MRSQLGFRCEVIAAVLATLLLAAPVHAQSVSVAVQRVDASQFPSVRTYVSVANANGAPIVGLDPRAFQVQEDGKPVDDVAVKAASDTPDAIVTALLLDVSASMSDQGKLDRVKEAAVAYVDSFGSADRGAVVSFASRVTLVQDNTADKAALKSAIESVSARGDKVLYDALAQTARRQAQQPERRKPIILVTDGADTASSESPDAAILSATTAGSAIYAIGLGSNAPRDLLVRLSAATGGRAVLLSDPGDLKPTFLAIADQLRRAYLLTYASKLPPDSKSHGLAVQVTNLGQVNTGLGTFTIAASPAVTITGLNAGMTVAGVQHINVDVRGGAQLVQLLVDNQVRATARGVPTGLDWDTSVETAGAHQVVVRTTDLQGVATDSAFPISVASQPSSPAAGTAQPAAAPTPIPVPPASGIGIDSNLLVGLLLLMFLIVGSAWYLTRARHAPAATGVGPPPPVPPLVPQPTQTRGDMTEEVAGPANAGGATVVRPGREKAPPRVRLTIVQDGQPSEFVSRESPITLGRDQDRATVCIPDPLVSNAHARIRRDGSQFFLEDMTSRNGTRVNGEPIPPETPRLLKNNDRIYIGKAVVTFTVEPH